MSKYFVVLFVLFLAALSVAEPLLSTSHEIHIHSGFPAGPPLGVFPAVAPVPPGFIRPLHLCLQSWQLADKFWLLASFISRGNTTIFISSTMFARNICPCK
uniref:Uncharacterized protein n=1 Tax=Panagrolaimus sp. JU765 TaxID=591449 RepID=A0AC34QVN3_9BILA